MSIWYIPLLCLGATCSWRSTVSRYLFAIKSNLEKVVKGCRHSLAFHAIFVKRCEFAAGAYIWWSAVFVTHICCPQMLSIIEMQFHRNTFAIFKKFQFYLNDIVDLKKSFIGIGFWIMNIFDKCSIIPRKGCLRWEAEMKEKVEKTFAHFSSSENISLQAKTQVPNPSWSLKGKHFS